MLSVSVVGVGFNQLSLDNHYDAMVKCSKYFNGCGLVPSAVGPSFLNHLPTTLLSSMQLLFLGLVTQLSILLQHSDLKGFGVWTIPIEISGSKKKKTLGIDKLGWLL